MKALSAKFVRDVTEPGRYYDGDAGLFLLVADGVRGMRKSYVQRLTIHGRRRDIGLGSTRWLPLTEARGIAQANRKVARMGGDPLAAKRPAVPTFAAMLEAVIEAHRGGWKDGGKSEAHWRSSVTRYAGELLNRPVDAITATDLLAVLTRGEFWNRKRETARKVKQRLSTILDRAVAEGHRTDNPCLALRAALPKNGGALRAHHRALPYGDVSGALAAVRASGAWWATKAAFEFLTLTAARSGEVRGMQWCEVEGSTWTVPAARMKTGRAHAVPLSPRALAIIDDARQYSDGTGLVFPSPTGRTLSDMTMSKLVKELGIEAVPHGFRSSFRQWAAERTNIPREVCEFALAHVVGDAAERAYQRSDLYAKRAELMRSWARYLDTSSADVVELRRA